MVVLHEMSHATDVLAALEKAGIDSASFIESWHAQLADEVSRLPLDQAPHIGADLVVSGKGDYRDIAVAVEIVNPETDSYEFEIALTIDGEPVRQYLQADQSDYAATIPITRVKKFTPVRWNASVSSRTLGTAVYSGWQEEVVWRTD